MSAHPVARYIPLLIAGDEQGLRDLFDGPPRINDPHVGWVEESLAGVRMYDDIEHPLQLN